MLNVEIRLPGTGQHYDFALDETAPVAAVTRAVAEAICAAPRESPERAFSINRRKPRMPWPEFEYMPAFFMSASRLARRD